MVEPFTIVTTVASLVCSALKSIQALNAYHGQYNRAAITMASIMSQCSCIEFAIVQVQEVILESSPSAYLLSTDNALTKHFTSVFGACEIVFSILIERLKDLSAGEVDERGQLSKMTKLKYVWNDQDMKDLLRNLESQASAFNLLLAALQMRSNVDVHKLLSQNDSRRLLNKVTDDAASLKTAEDTRIQESLFEKASIMGKSDDVEPSLHSTFDEAEFEFDYELINTTTYRKAFLHVARSNMTQPVAGIMESGSMPHNESILEDFRSVLGLAFESPIELEFTTTTGDILPKCMASGSGPVQKSTADSSRTTSNQSTSKGEAPEMTNGQLKSNQSDKHLKATDGLERVLIDLEAAPEADPRVVPAIPESLYNVLLTLEPAEPDTPVRITQSQAKEESRSPNKVTTIALVTNNQKVAKDDFSVKNIRDSRSETDLRELETNLVCIMQATISPNKSILAPLTAQMRLPVGPYSLRRYVSEAASSCVFQADKNGTLDKVAFKVVHRKQNSYSGAFTRRDQLKRTHMEVAILHDLCHVNIIRILDLMELENYLVFVMPFIGDQSSPHSLLSYILRQRQRPGLWAFPEVTAWNLFNQLLSGVKYLHDNQTIHHNLTLDNLLYDPGQEKIVIKGFSLAEVIPRNPGSVPLSPSSSSTTRVIRKPVPTRKYLNPYFTAPEILGSEIDPSYSLEPIKEQGKVDVYSCGVILLALLDGALPYNGNMVMTQFAPIHAQEHLAKIKNTPLEKTLALHHRGKRRRTRDLLTDLLQPEYKFRYNIVQSIEYAWAATMNQNSEDGLFSIVEDELLSVEPMVAAIEQRFMLTYRGEDFEEDSSGYFVS